MEGFAAILWLRGEAILVVLRSSFVQQLPGGSPPKRFPAEESRPWKRARQTNLSKEILMSTFSAKPAEVVHEWFVIDATDKVLGRVASEVALRLRGKHKAIYTPHVDTGDFIVIINASQLRVTGAKPIDKVYYSHSGYPGGISAINFRDMQSKFPGRALEKAVKGMLPKGPLGYAMIKKLKVYGGAEHPHTAQQPKVLDIPGISANATKRESAK
jgi:large subunit ribosomal protein L13